MEYQMTSLFLLFLAATKTCASLPCSTSITFSVTVVSNMQVSSNIEEVEPNTGVYKLAVNVNTFHIDNPISVQESYLLIHDRATIDDSVAMVWINFDDLTYSFPDSVIAFKWNENSAKAAIAFVKQKDRGKTAIARATKGKKK